MSIASGNIARKYSSLVEMSPLRMAFTVPSFDAESAFKSIASSSAAVLAARAVSSGVYGPKSTYKSSIVLSNFAMERYNASSSGVAVSSATLVAKKFKMSPRYELSIFDRTANIKSFFARNSCSGVNLPCFFISASLCFARMMYAARWSSFVSPNDGSNLICNCLLIELSLTLCP